MSSMLSAPATIPATRDASFSPAFAPLSVGTVSRSSASSRSPASRANVITGSSPATATRFGSSKEADTAAGLWKTCTFEMLLFFSKIVLSQVQFSLKRRASRL